MAKSARTSSSTSRDRPDAATGKTKPSRSTGNSTRKNNKTGPERTSKSRSNRAANPSKPKESLAQKSKTNADRAPWTFLTNHSHVLICLWRRPDARLRDVAQRVGITERAVQAIVADLEEAGVLTRTRQGRRNHYTIHDDAPLRHPVESAHRIGELLQLVGHDESPSPPPSEDTSDG